MTRDQPVVAIYPGSFDPVTKGHEDVARRSLRIVDRVIVAVAHTATQVKGGLFNYSERMEMLQEVFANDERIEVLAPWADLQGSTRSDEPGIVE